MTRYNFTKASDGMGEVFSRVNRLAHQFATQEEARLRTLILHKVEEAKDNGASASDLRQLVAQIDADGLASFTHPRK